jgi:hypothetical protein
MIGMKKIEQLRERARGLGIVGEAWVDLIHRALELHAMPENEGIFSAIGCVELLLEIAERERNEG